jgi:hypothetical protein
LRWSRSRPQQRIALRDLAACDYLGVDTHIDVAESAPQSCDDVEVPVTGLTWVAAHLVIGEITRSRAAPRVISEFIQSCSLQAAAPSKYRFARNRMISAAPDLFQARFKRGG